MLGRDFMRFLAVHGRELFSFWLRLARRLSGLHLCSAAGWPGFSCARQGVVNFYCVRQGLRELIRFEAVLGRELGQFLVVLGRELVRFSLCSAGSWCEFSCVLGC